LSDHGAHGAGEPLGWLPESANAIPVVVLNDADHAVPMARALEQGGIPCAEITLRTSCALAALEAVAAAIDAGALDAGFGLGAGTVLNAGQARAAIRAGARYLVSPGVDEGVWSAGLDAGVPVLLGASTATDVQRAHNLGAREVKFFPAATSGGPPALKALSGPFGDMQFVPTGGISLGDAPNWLRLPMVRAVGGSWIAPSSLTDAEQFDRVRAIARETAAALAGHTQPRRPSPDNSGRNQ
jgi:2-dehydro-3-deoxyphosphogluconate aldolase/(4S)-4-hydroxy-2-oxoglutarate aldolase